MRLLESYWGQPSRVASVRPAPRVIMEHQVERGERTKKVGRQKEKRRIRLEAGIARRKEWQPASLRTHHLLAGGWTRHPVHSPAISACEFQPVVFSEGEAILMCG